jgi:HK97 family phage portal protein
MFGRNKYKQEAEIWKQKFAEFEVHISEQNELYRAIYDFLSTGLALGKDSNMRQYVSEGYEGNPDLFSIALKLAGMFAEVPQKLVEMKSDGTEVDAYEQDIASIMRKPNYYQTYNEFKVAWAVFRYITGNAIVYAPKLPAGLNKGKLTNDGMLMMPSQDVTIKAKNWREPVGYYTLDMNERYKIEASDVWHERFAPTLQYSDGKNFMGTSPVKVAANLINSQNKGYEISARTYSNMHPPGIVYKEGESDETTDVQESKFRATWGGKYSNVNNFKSPVFTRGKVGFVKIGYDNLRELQIIEMSEHGKRIFCNLLQVPSVLFGDTKASTYDNMTLAEKAIYRHRIIPDQVSFCEGFTEILQAYGPFKLVADYSEIECLQEDKAKKVEWISQAFNDSAITGDQYLEMLGLEPTGLPEMQVRYISANKIPLNFSEEDISESDKYYHNHEIQHEL